MKIRFKRNELYLIVDFGASQNHTHHKESICSFAELISGAGLDYEVWIPAGSEINQSNLPIKRNLLPGYNPIGFAITKPSTWISGIHGKVHGFSNDNGLLLILRLLATLNSLHFIFLLFIKKFRYKKIKIIFTTMCAFSFRSLYMLEASRVKIESFCRLTNTSERRGKLSEIISYANFINESKTFTYVQIRFGVETNAYLKKIQLEKDSRGYISKFPSRPSIHNKLVNSSQVTISFLGYPTQHKGQKHIFPIVNQIGQTRPSINWQIHLFEDDELIPVLKKTGIDIKMLTGKISSKSMVDALSKSSLICLPYDVVAFKYNSSAMMYQAADFLVPILTFSGSAFAEEVEHFECGLVADNEEELISKIINLDLGLINKWIDGCKRYNDFRSKSNHVFLGI
jgi:glycosyltransferase involved in cell wall biosynthesis